MFIALNLRGIGASVVSFGSLLCVGHFLEQSEVVGTGTVVAGTVIGGALIYSLFALSTDKCDSPGIFRAYWNNFQQVSYEALGHVPPDHFTVNPARQTAMLGFPLALFPHILAIGMFCTALPGIAKGQPSKFDIGLWKFLPIAMISASLATMYGYATSGLRQVAPVPKPTIHGALKTASWLNVRNWQILCGLLVATALVTMMVLGRPFRESLFLGLALGVGPLSLITAILNFEWYFKDRSMQNLQSGAFGFQGPQAARATIFLIGAFCTAFGVYLIMNPGTFR